MKVGFLLDRPVLIAAGNVLRHDLPVPVDSSAPLPAVEIFVN